VDHVNFRCHLSAPTTPLPHFWEHTVGSCHAPLALRADWQSQLRRAHEELGFRYVRFHGLLCDDVGTFVRYHKRTACSFFNADLVVDFLLSIGMKPFVELSFMPEALASGDQTVFHYGANVTPPKNYRQWGVLIGKLVGHWVKRYGAEEVRSWFFEVWNEPNWPRFWTGSQEDYFKLYEASARALKRVDDGLRVGGPATANNGWVDEFLDHCVAHDLPVDFVSTHQYPNDVPGHEKDDTETQLAAGRRGLLRDWVADVRRQARGKPLYYTEWNTSSNPRDPLHDDPYAAAFAVKTVLDANGLVDGYAWWTFSDIFEEEYFPSVPFHGGFGLLNLHGIAKPTYRAFEMLHRLGDALWPVQGTHPTLDVWVAKGKGAVTVLVTNHALPRHLIQGERLHVVLGDAPEPQRAYIERIDDSHGNPKRSWQAIGEPEYLSPALLERLQEASRLERKACNFTYRDGAIHLDLDVRAHSVAGVTLKFGPQHLQESTADVP
jgi:xylan 1,4-beta-xylosidase